MIRPSVVSCQSSLIQQPLPLTDRPDDEASLRAAFHRLDLERVCKMSFEQFVGDTMRRKSLANVIEARLRARAAAPSTLDTRPSISA